MKLKYIFILVACGIFVLVIFVQVFRAISQSTARHEDSRSVMIGKPHQTAEGLPKDAPLQSISYGNPDKIQEFPYYVMEVSPISLDTNANKNSPPVAPSYSPKNQQGQGGGGGDYDSRRGRQFKDYINILFLDQDYAHIHTLLDKKAIILDVWYPIHILPKPYSSQPKEADDSTRKALQKLDSVALASQPLKAKDFPYIFYSIVFEDTNKDGRLNEKDRSNLYISDINGKNLRKVGGNVEIWDFQLWKNEKKFYITYRDRDEDIRYYKKRFAFYDINTHTFTPIKTTHEALDEVEKILTK